MLKKISLSTSLSVTSTLWNNAIHSSARVMSESTFLRITLCKSGKIWIWSVVNFFFTVLCSVLKKWEHRLADNCQAPGWPLFVFNLLHTLLIFFNIFFFYPKVFFNIDCFLYSIFLRILIIFEFFSIFLKTDSLIRFVIFWTQVPAKYLDFGSAATDNVAETFIIVSIFNMFLNQILCLFFNLFIHKP